jgi:cytochrome c peroxidase
MRSIPTGLMLLFFFVGACVIAVDAKYFSAAQPARSAGLAVPVGNTRGNANDLGRYTQAEADADMGASKRRRYAMWSDRGPYLHDSSFPTVKDAFAHYLGGGNGNAHLDREIHSLDPLSFDERDDLRAFLDALNGQLPDNMGRRTWCLQPRPKARREINSRAVCGA